MNIENVQTVRTNNNCVTKLRLSLNLLHQQPGVFVFNTHAVVIVPVYMVHCCLTNRVVLLYPNKVMGSVHLACNVCIFLLSLLKF